MALLMLWVLFPVFSGVIASARGRDVLGWGLVGLLFGPFGLVVGLLPSLAPRPARGALAPRSIACSQCREPIAFDARRCKHCGTRYPYLQEPARSQVALIADRYAASRAPAAIAEEMNRKGMHPADRRARWAPADIEAIIEHHVR
ncbi:MULTISPECIES: zinc ribbon domain-containing protein [unclassified Marichromatium]|uniref:zinc ribbon domain-containing protein n=1 Tax=unclassified Marichromatium TaxID=2618417 RepID=UPI000F3D4AC6|nr:zinc ribbon domain-containing protein [Marichromatium sp. AB31]RNE88732.1 hypothetical protein EBL84_14675 [Marichromatium sp. AB31]